MAKKIALGQYEPSIFKVKVSTCNETDGNSRTLVDYSEKSVTGQPTDPFTEYEIKNNGLVVEMEVDQLAQSIAYLREQTDGKASATEVVKSMISKSADILDDEIFNITIECLKAARRRTDDACIDNICKGLEGLLNEYKVYLR